MINLLLKFISDQPFYVAITDADIGSLNLSIGPTLFDKYLDNMLVKFETKKIVRCEICTILSFLAKNG